MKQVWVVSRVGELGVEVCGVYSDQEKADRALVDDKCAAALFMVDTDATDQKSFAMMTKARPQPHIVTPIDVDGLTALNVRLGTIRRS
jgi:hypothetical protein